MGRISWVDLEASCWIVATGALAALSVVLWLHARDMMALDVARAVSWCGPDAHLQETFTMFGHCLRCWPAFAAGGLALATAVQAMSSVSTAPLRAP